MSDAPADTIAAMLWAEDDQREQAVELLRAVPELIGPVSAAAAETLPSLEAVYFIEEAAPETIRPVADALMLGLVDMMLDQLRDAERAVLYPLYDRVCAVHAGEEDPREATRLGYRIVLANRDRLRVRQLVRAMLSTLEPVDLRAPLWWEQVEALIEVTPELAARVAWELAWDQATAAGKPRAEVRSAARTARDHARASAAAEATQAILQSARKLVLPAITQALDVLVGAGG